MKSQSANNTIKEAKRNYIKLFGVQEYLKSYLGHLKTLNLSQEEVFENYYRVREETLKEFAA